MTKFTDIIKNAENWVKLHQNHPQIQDISAKVNAALDLLNEKQLTEFAIRGLVVNLNQDTIHFNPEALYGVKKVLIAELAQHSDIVHPRTAYIIKSEIERRGKKLQVLGRRDLSPLC